MYTSDLGAPSGQKPIETLLGEDGLLLPAWIALKGWDWEVLANASILCVFNRILTVFAAPGLTI